MSGREVVRREDLELPYRHPYRHWLPEVWDAANVRWKLAGGAAGAITGGVLAVVDGEAGWLVAGLLALLVVLVVAARWTVAGALAIRRHVKTWDAPSELSAVRAQRPHAGDADPDVVHDEFAVTVEEQGLLYLWRFRPLDVGDVPRADEVPVPGRPCHAAKVESERPFDGADASRAAEQLADAQHEAATLEAEARDRAQRGLEEAERHREIAAETSSTAAALRHLTGQDAADRPRRGLRRPDR